MEVQVHERESPQEDEDRDVEDVLADEHEPDLTRNARAGQPAEGVHARVKGDQYKGHELGSSHNTLNREVKMEEGLTKCCTKKFFHPNQNLYNIYLPFHSLRSQKLLLHIVSIHRNTWSFFSFLDRKDL